MQWSRALFICLNQTLASSLLFQPAEIVLFSRPKHGSQPSFNRCSCIHLFYPPSRDDWGYDRVMLHGLQRAFNWKFIRSSRLLIEINLLFAFCYTSSFHQKQVNSRNIPITKGFFPIILCVFFSNHSLIFLPLSAVSPMKPSDESGTYAIIRLQRYTPGWTEAWQITGRHLITAADLNNGSGHCFFYIYLSGVLLACQMGTVSTIRTP